MTALLGLDRLFAGHDKVLVPWPRAGRLKHPDPTEQTRLKSYLARPPQLTDVDPRDLRAGQPWILRQHVEFYLSGVWERTGTTSADMGHAANRFPVVVVSAGGERVIVSGHHRAAAALIGGWPLRCRLVEDNYPSRSDRTVTPLLKVDAGCRLVDADMATFSQRYGAGDQVTVSTDEEARSVLRSSVLGPTEIEERIRYSRTGRVG